MSGHCSVAGSELMTHVVIARICAFSSWNFCVGGALATPFVSELRAFVAPPANSGGPLCSCVGAHCPYSESDGVVA